MASTNSQNPACPNCNKNGLLILPVRYAVVPLSVDATLPEPLGDKVKNIKVSHHKYALRTLREGFVYLFYEKHARGSHIKWEAYSVSRTGQLWKQLSVSAINRIPDDPGCSRTGHNIPASVIAIENPEKCGRVWMAFSEHAWSMDTFRLFEKESKARDRRMQTFEPAKWVSGGGLHHGLEANEANLSHVLEYKDKATYNALLPTAEVPMLSKPDGSFVAARLAKQTTRYPFYNRKSQTRDLLTLMKKGGENQSGNDNPPAIVALWDAVGIAHELAGFCHDVLSWLEKYNQEKELELSAMNLIEGLKKALPEKAVASELQFQKAIIDQTRVGSRNAQLRANAQRYPEPQRSRTLEVCDIIDDWASKDLNSHRLEMQLMQSNMQPEPERALQIKAIRAEAKEFLATRNRNMRQQVSKTHASAWQKYEKKLDTDGYDNFRDHHQRLLTAAEAILEDRAGDLVEWLASTSLTAALTEFHTENTHDGAVFNEQVGDVIFGMNASQKGGAKLDEWIREMKTGESNLLWRAVALNQRQSMEELNSALAEAQKHQAQRTMASALNWTTYATKSLKAFADTYKKMNSVQNANTSASSVSGSAAFGVVLRPVNMRGIDKLVVTAGDRIFKAFRVPGLLDHASEKIIQHVFSLRAFVASEDSVRLIEAQAQNAGPVRTQQLERLHGETSSLAADKPAIRTPQSESLRRAWEEFKSKNSGSANAIKDARLALLIMLIEGLNFSKLLAGCTMKNDAKSWWSLAASGLTIASSMFEVATVPAKAIFLAESLTFQNAKLAGGLFGCSASMIGAVMDIGDAVKFYGKGKTSLAVAYFAKGALGLGSGGLTVAASFTYAAPLIGRLTGNVALRATAQVIGGRAAAVIGVRILFMSAGAWVTVFAFGIQALVWVILDDALEEWCSLCAFGGNSKSRGAYRTKKTQTDALEKALLEVGL